jgi:mono/diheme cytochrome c family protein
VLLALMAAGSAACRQDMHDAPRYDPLEASAILPGGGSAQPLIAGTVARNMLREDTAFYTGQVGGQHVTAFPFPIDHPELDRGHERFDIYCAPCHGRTGDGNGMVVQRGYRQPPSLHIDRLRNESVGYFYGVITNGFGTMPAYAPQVPPRDRWLIVAYIRALQLSQNAAEGDVPAEEMERLKSGVPAEVPAQAPEAAGH